MLSDISAYHHIRESELCKLRARLTELEVTLTLERDEAQATIQTQRQKLLQERKMHDSYASTIINQALDITTGICNVSGKLIPKDDTMYIMEQCGAVST